MWTAIRSVLVVLGITIAGLTEPGGASLTAASRSPGFVVASVLPAPGTVVGVAHPVVIAFGAPVGDRRAVEHALEVSSTPAMTGTFEWLGQDVVQWVPDRFWPAHSTIALSVGGLATDFRTGPAVLAVANVSDHTFVVSIDGVQGGTPPVLPAPHHRPHWGEEGVLPASMGKTEFPTPVGSYAVIAKDRSVVMDSSTVGIPVTDPEGYHLAVDYGVRITSRGLYVHSAPWALPALGVENVSHGCINLSPADAQWYYDTVNIGDPVIVVR